MEVPGAGVEDADAQGRRGLAGKAESLTLPLQKTDRWTLHTKVVLETSASSQEAKPGGQLLMAPEEEALRLQLPREGHGSLDNERWGRADIGGQCALMTCARPPP